MIAGTLLTDCCVFRPTSRPTQITGVLAAHALHRLVVSAGLGRNFDINDEFGRSAAIVLTPLLMGPNCAELCQLGFQPYWFITDISHKLPRPSIFHLALQASRLPQAAANVAGQSPMQHGRAPDSRFARVVKW